MFVKKGKSRQQRGKTYLNCSCHTSIFFWKRYCHVLQYGQLFCVTLVLTISSVAAAVPSATTWRSLHDIGNNRLHKKVSTLYKSRSLVPFPYYITINELHPGEPRFMLHHNATLTRIVYQVRETRYVNSYIQLHSSYHSQGEGTYATVFKVRGLRSVF
jgi:hypothetical protein